MFFIHNSKFTPKKHYKLQSSEKNVKKRTTELKKYKPAK